MTSQSSHNNKIFFTGGSGLIGRYLQPKFYVLGFKGTILTRSSKLVRSSNEYGFDYIKGDITDTHWLDQIKGHQSIVHLAGFPLFEKKWSSTTKQLIKDSRVIGTRNLVEAISKLPKDCRPGNVICASAVGYYGTSFDQTFDESNGSGDDFLAEVAYLWEQEAMHLKQIVKNLSVLRIGVVLSTKGGMLKRILPIFKSGLGGRLSSGKQWISWVHIEDVSRVIIKSITDDSWKPGIYNLVSPNPVTNLCFTKKLGSKLKRPVFIPVPKKVLNSILGEGSYYVVTGQKALPKKLLQNSYEFKFVDLDKALEDLLNIQNSPSRS